MPSAAVGKRICVIGTSGSGKTHVAQAIAEKLGMPYVSVDALIWARDWQPVPRDQQLANFEVAFAGPAWVTDGNLGPSPAPQLLLSRCDTLVWLDLPRWQVHGQSGLRTLGRVISREELWHGNRESLRRALSPRVSAIWWSMRTYATIQRHYRRLLQDPSQAGRARIRLRSGARLMTGSTGSGRVRMLG